MNSVGVVPVVAGVLIMDKMLLSTNIINIQLPLLPRRLLLLHHKIFVSELHSLKHSLNLNLNKILSPHHVIVSSGRLKSEFFFIIVIKQ